MRQNASKCTQNELCKCFMHKIFKEVVFILQNRLKLTIFLAKIAHFVLSNQNTSICIRIHQNVCRMNCANVLCTILSKKWFLLHFNMLKLKNYLLLFVMEDPVPKMNIGVSKIKLNMKLATITIRTSTELDFIFF